MYKKSFYILFIFALMVNLSFSKTLIDCRVLTHSTIVECNPYGAKLLRVKVDSSGIGSKKFTKVKTIPTSVKATLKVVSIQDISKEATRDPMHFSVSRNIFTENNQTNFIPSKAVAQVVIDTNISTVHRLENKVHKKLYGIYEVVSGDIVGHIATKFGMKVDALLLLNKLEKKSTLHIGQTFKIPLSQKKIDAITRAAYTIEAGDTLLSIAYMFNVDPKLLVTFNHLNASAFIREGKVLDLPLPYVLKKIQISKKKALAKKEAFAKKTVLAKKLRLKKVAKARKSKLRKKSKSKKRKFYVKKIGKHKLRVTATAYSSHKAQTDSTPFLAAWNNRLRPGMKIIAVSRDLLKRYGLRNGTRVRIGGLRGYYRVRDKMNKRFKKRIDIYMGLNRKRALRWGKRSVVIYW